MAAGSGGKKRKREVKRIGSKWGETEVLANGTCKRK